jgi:hypothetical protein
MKCINCQSDNITDRVFIEDRGHGDVGRPIKIRADKDPAAWVFKGSTRFGVKTFICLDCGYIASFCLDIEKLKQTLNILE